MIEKVYIENPYLREFTAKVIKKERINNEYYITLNRTIFYPHMSGGQPRDKGTMNDIEVKNVFEENGKIVHVLNDNIDSKNVNLSIDWETRFDHMQQHTGQHLLSAVIYKLYNADTVGFHLGSKYVYIDVTIPRLTHHDIERIEKFANKIIYSNFNIKAYTVGKSDLARLPLRKQPTVDSNIRIVEIDNIDFSPCAGTHCRNIGEIGILKIRKWEKYKGNTRIEFVCGNRALKDYTWKNNYINDISSLLSLKDNDTYKGVEKLLEENISLQKDLSSLKEELLVYKSKELLYNCIKFNEIKIVKKIFENNNLKDIRYIASNIISNTNTTCILGLVENDRCQLILGRSENIDLDMKEIFDSVIDLISGRGGGNSQLVQGGGSNIKELSFCMDTALNLIKSKL
ncbi:alanyl-tRNA editing protein AlaXL [Gottschalkia purinilytica]|uniref:Alanyl-tRNA editing protein AlaXL n=1 Tax=Gottschalkia purinilytica TaxID=1503 RepID=A0A0L0WD29_GOTPU|nr:DHHA1 domain-containing protein [Gottschalkia purinilytica]KNF09377.1 alanyl-tRNA editing protein AlaXL [Gottschalkia purinilytica]